MLSQNISRFLIVESIRLKPPPPWGYNIFIEPTTAQQYLMSWWPPGGEAKQVLVGLQAGGAQRRGGFGGRVNEGRKGLIIKHDQ